MAHKTDRADVYAAVDRYRALTGDREAVLIRDGAYYYLNGRHPHLEGYGKATFYALLRVFCEAWQAALDSEDLIS